MVEEKRDLSPFRSGPTFFHRQGLITDAEYRRLLDQERTVFGMPPEPFGSDIVHGRVTAEPVIEILPEAPETGGQT
ncbi:MAG: hypothetical protein HYV40_00620 [Candidatus Levybacteria bacterium]|nr:hypothetical protein [Candidatus Levybacteria bacterium]